MDHDFDADPVTETVRCGSEQRMIIVKRCIQYEFLYETVRAIWENMHGVGDAVVPILTRAS